LLAKNVIVLFETTFAIVAATTPVTKGVAVNWPKLSQKILLGYWEVAVRNLAAEQFFFSRQ
jgi:hypothetical protein